MPRRRIDAAFGAKHGCDRLGHAGMPGTSGTSKLGGIDVGPSPPLWSGSLWERVAMPICVYPPSGESFGIVIIMIDGILIDVYGA